MTYDWLAQAYASGPTMTKEGKRHRAKYLRHWAKRMKPEDPVDTAHIEALAEEEEREKARIAAEKLAIDAARKARDAEESEWEEVPFGQWKVGDEIEAVEAGWAFDIGTRHKIKSVDSTGVELDSFGWWFAHYFRLRRRKNKGIKEGDLVKLLPIDFLDVRIRSRLDRDLVGGVARITVVDQKCPMLLGFPSAGGDLLHSSTVTGWWPLSHMQRIDE